MRTIKRPSEKLSDKLLDFTETIKRPQTIYKSSGAVSPFYFFVSILPRKIASVFNNNIPLDIF